MIPFALCKNWILPHLISNKWNTAIHITIIDEDAILLAKWVYNALLLIKSWFSYSDKPASSHENGIEGKHRWHSLDVINIGWYQCPLANLTNWPCMDSSTNLHAWGTNKILYYSNILIPEDCSSSWQVFSQYHNLLYQYSSLSESVQDVWKLYPLLDFWKSRKR